MVLLCGIPSERPLSMVRERLEQYRTPHLVLSQRRFADTAFRFEIAGGRLTGEFAIDGRRYPLDDVTGVYTRFMDDQALPELAGEPPASPRRLQARAWHAAVSQWYEVAPIRVVNRAASMASNASKPFQAQQILKHGLLIPETLVTSDPDEVRAFRETYRTIIFKSTSGVRSIVRVFDDTDLSRLDAIRECPVQFQQYIPGANLRVHVVGSELFATRIVTGATDYRYAQRQGSEAAVLETIETSDDLGQQCIALARDLDLPFAGIDLKVTPDDEVYCFEVNPSPAFSYYESHTGQPIAAALARFLANV
jgi:glutathione synthase/RimK-type ligase-like ATP-grasp enzyme